MLNLQFMRPFRSWRYRGVVVDTASSGFISVALFNCSAFLLDSFSFSCSFSNSGRVGQINKKYFFFFQGFDYKNITNFYLLLYYRSLQELKIEQTKLEEAKREAEQLNDATDMKPEDAVSTTTPLYRQLLNGLMNFGLFSMSI